MVRERLIQLCVEGLKEKGLYEQPEYKERLKEEVVELDTQADHEYFLEIFDAKTKFPENEYNLLIPYLLGIVDKFDIETPPAYEQGEFPDIDIDYLAPVRDYLKNEWAPKVFGEDKVCNIGNYTTFGIKSALIDMARVHDCDRIEIQALTKKLGLKDDEGATLTWDSALNLHKDLQEYCDNHPDVADSAHRLLNRNRGMGQHAGGLIISKSPINNLVPLVKGKDNTYASAWTEGLHSQDLQPVGLVKFDLLVITDLLRIAYINNLIKKRHGVESICAFPDQPDWSDTTYLNDPAALALANEGRLKGIFQFDSFGIRRLCREGGVTSFNDLVAYNALYRPGPLGMKMHDVYAARKRNADGKEIDVEHYGWEKEIPKCLEPILLNTYGVMCFQEQVMQILNVVGDIPLTHCELIRKAISKKKVEYFGKYKEMFVKNGQKNLDWDEEKVLDLWDQIESFAEYGFNKSHSVAYTYISSRLLWQKAHYPLEFFTGTLQCEKKDIKIKEYKLDSERFEIKTEHLDLNKSKVNFEIDDKTIYMGFSKVKGIGEDVAKRIVEHQPYDGIVDFMERFGTDMGVMKPMISLSVFSEADNKTLYQFYEHFKKETKKREDRCKRNLKSREKIMDELFAFWPEEGNEPDADCLLKWINKAAEFPKDKGFVEYMMENDWEHLCRQEKQFPMSATDAFKIIKKYRRNIQTFEEKEKISEENPIVFDGFVPEGEVDSKMSDNLEDRTTAERNFYGFVWIHPIESSPDYVGNKTFYQFEDDVILAKAAVECQIVAQPLEKISKKDTPYYIVKVEDADSNQNDVIFWKDDYERFKEDLNVWDGTREMGHFLSLRVEKPTPGFKAYKFDSPPRHKRKHEVPENKSEDHRLVILRKSNTDLDLSELCDGID